MSDEWAKPLEARFTFHRANAQFSGGLRLKRPGDPLTLRVDGGSAETLTAEAWAAALIVYAELTCVGISGRPPPGADDPHAASAVAVTDSHTIQQTATSARRTQINTTSAAGHRAADPARCDRPDACCLRTYASAACRGENK